MSEEKTKLSLADTPQTYLEAILELPLSTYRHIGRIISAHAFLEAQVFDTLCTIAEVGPSAGHVLLRYQAATERFKTIRKLLVLHGIKPKANLKSLYSRIEKCCRTRDAFAHGLWMRTKEGELALRLTRGEYEIEGGVADRSFVPQVSTYTPTFILEMRKIIIDIGWEVQALRDEIKDALAARHAKS